MGPEELAGYNHIAVSVYDEFSMPGYVQLDIWILEQCFNGDQV